MAKTNPYLPKRPENDPAKLELAWVSRATASCAETLMGLAVVLFILYIGFGRMLDNLTRQPDQASTKKKG